MASPSVAVFSHIPKTGGLSVVRLLRRHFGRGHVDVIYRTPVVYLSDDFRQDWRLHRGFRSLAGHSLKPYVDFGSIDAHLHWYTFLREPIARFVSHYQQEVEKGGKAMNLVDWASAFRRQNWQVRMLAGEENVEHAIAVLESKFEVVGLLEEFDRSLLMIKTVPGLEDLDLADHRRVNTSRSAELRKQIEDQVAANAEHIHAQNELDIQLFAYARTTVWPRMVERCGGAERLEADLAALAGSEPTRSPLGFARQAVSRVQRNVIYKPFVKAFGRDSTERLNERAR